MIRAYEMPLDDLLHKLGEAFGFAVQVDCGTEACPPFSGRLSGGLEAVLGLVLLGRNYSLIHGAPAEPGGPTRLESLAVLAGPRAPDESLPEGPTWGDGPAITVWETNPVPPPGQQPDGELGVEGVKRIFATVGLGPAALFGGARRPEAGDGNDSAEAAARARLDALGALYDALGSLRGLPLVAPLSPYHVTSRFGPRRDPVTGQQALHQGIDLVAPARSQVMSTAPGRVAAAGWHGAYGHLVEIDHGYGIRTRYGHLDEILVRPGQAVGAGAPVGVIGSSGRSTGRHLHYEVRVRGQPLDPARFLRAGRLAMEG